MAGGRRRAKRRRGRRPNAGRRRCHAAAGSSTKGPGARPSKDHRLARRGRHAKAGDGCGLTADCLVLLLHISEVEMKLFLLNPAITPRPCQEGAHASHLRGERGNAVRVAPAERHGRATVAPSMTGPSLSPSIPPSIKARCTVLTADSSSEMAPEEGLEPTTLRLTALPAASPFMRYRPLPSLLDLARWAPCPGSSPQIPAETQDSAIISPSFDCPIDQARHKPISRPSSPADVRAVAGRLGRAGLADQRDVGRRMSF